MNSPEVSIIIPVWNAEHFLNTCISSIFKQTFQNWEVILSDDGSTDSSFSICTKFSVEDTRVKVLQNAHMGVSYARNKALNIATGKYICFIDADDTIEPDFLSSLLLYNNYDLIVCGYYVDITNENGALLKQEKHTQKELPYLISDKNKMKNLFESGVMHMNWNKLWRKDIIDKHNIRYKPYPINEDFLFMIEYLKHINNLYVIDKPLYHWKRIINNISGVESIPYNMIDIFNEAHEQLRLFFSPTKDVAEEIMFFTYELIALKYIKAIKNKRIKRKEGLFKINELMNNKYVKQSFIIHKPETFGSKIFHYLLKNKHIRLYMFLNSLYNYDFK